jgi:hypothetical protein
MDPSSGACSAPHAQVLRLAAGEACAPYVFLATFRAEISSEIRTLKGSAPNRPWPCPSDCTLQVEPWRARGSRCPVRVSPSTRERLRGIVLDRGWGSGQSGALSGWVAASHRLGATASLFGGQVLDGPAFSHAGAASCSRPCIRWKNLGRNEPGPPKPSRKSELAHCACISATLS